jgi:hypothetical protein
MTVRARVTFKGANNGRIVPKRRSIRPPCAHGAVFVFQTLPSA